MELAGVEPASKHGTSMLSTCLVLLYFRDLPDAKQSNLSLVPVYFAIGLEPSSGYPRILSAFLSGWNKDVRRKTSRPDLLVEIKLKLLYSLKRRERKYFRLLLFCDTVLAMRHHTLHAYILPLMLSKPVSPAGICAAKIQKIDKYNKYFLTSLFGFFRYLIFR